MNFAAPMLFQEEWKSLNFHDSNSNLNFPGSHVILEKKEKNKFFQLEFEFEFSWHPCYFTKKAKI